MGKQTTYKVEGKGYLFISRGDGSNISVPCWYKPSITAKFISPGEAVSANKNLWKAHTIFSHHFKGSGEVRFHGNDPTNDDIFLTDYYKKKAINQSILPYKPSNIKSPSHSKDDRVHALTEEGTRILCHQRLGHMNLKRVSNLHKSVDGIPNIKHHCVLDSCPSCLSAKLRRVPAGDGSNKLMHK